MYLSITCSKRKKWIVKQKNIPFLQTSWYTPPNRHTPPNREQRLDLCVSWKYVGALLPPLQWISRKTLHIACCCGIVLGCSKNLARTHIVRYLIRRNTNTTISTVTMIHHPMYSYVFLASHRCCNIFTLPAI